MFRPEDMGVRVKNGETGLSCLAFDPNKLSIMAQALRAAKGIAMHLRPHLD